MNMDLKFLLKKHNWLHFARTNNNTLLLSYRTVERPTITCYNKSVCLSYDDHKLMCEYSNEAPKNSWVKRNWVSRAAVVCKWAVHKYSVSCWAVVEPAFCCLTQTNSITSSFDPKQRLLAPKQKHDRRTHYPFRWLTVLWQHCHFSQYFFSWTNQKTWCSFNHQSLERYRFSPRQEKKQLFPDVFRSKTTEIYALKMSRAIQ